MGNSNWLCFLYTFFLCHMRFDGQSRFNINVLKLISGFIMLLANYTFVLLAMFLLYVSTYPFSFYLIFTFCSLFIVITLPVLSAYCTFCSISLVFKNMLQKLQYKRSNTNKKKDQKNTSVICQTNVKPKIKWRTLRMTQISVWELVTEKLVTLRKVFGISTTARTG